MRSIIVGLIVTVTILGIIAILLGGLLTDIPIFDTLLVVLIGIFMTVLILSVLVILHEFGHYLTARFFGVRVLEFGIGFPPRIFGIWRGISVVNVVEKAEEYHIGKMVKIHCTNGKVVRGKVTSIEGTKVSVANMVWSINLLPIGGFVRMEGEENPDSPTSLAAAKPYKRLIILASGGIINILIPFIILPIASSIPSERVLYDITINGVFPGSPADIAGIESGDKVFSIDGAIVDTPQKLYNAISEKSGKTVTWTVIKEGTTSPKSLSIFHRTETPSKEVVNTLTDPKTQILLEDAKAVQPNATLGDKITEGEIGISIAAYPKDSQELELINNPFPSNIIEGWQRALNIIVINYVVLSDIISGDSQNDLNSGVSGPVAIGGILSQVATFGDLQLATRINIILNITAAISFSLGIINLLPIPALDGGRIFFVLLEMIRGGRRVSPQVEGIIHLIGFALLIAVIVLVTTNDINQILN